MPFIISDDAESIPKSSTPATEGKSQSRFVISDEPEQPSIGLGGQAAAGAASYLTWPADLFQAGVRASAQDILKEMNQDNPEAREAVERVVSKIPTQEGLEEYLEEKTGYRFKPKGLAEESARTAGQLFSPGGLVKSGAKQALKTISKRAIAATAGAGIQKGLETVGVNPFIASLAGIAGSSVGDIERKLSKEATEFKEIAKKHGLREASYMGREAPPSFPASITKNRAKGLEKEISETSKTAIENIIKNKHPLASLRAQGLSVEEYTNKILKETEQVAKKTTKPISLEPVVESIDQKISEIRKSAPSLSETDKKFLDILEEKKVDFQKTPSISYEQYLNQYRKNNSDRKAFYKNPQMTHLQEAANNAYGFLNENMIKNVEQNGEREFSTSLKAGNKLHQEKSNLLQTEAIFNPFFEDPSINNLNKILKNEKKVAFLKKNLGEDGIKEVREIGKYVGNAQKKLVEHFHQHGDSMLGIAKEFGMASLAAVVNPTAAVALDMGIAFSYMKGFMLTNKKLRGDYLNFSKAMASGNEKAIRTYSKKLNDDFEAEYGDPYEIIANQDSSL